MNWRTQIQTPKCCSADLWGPPEKATLILGNDPKPFTLYIPYNHYILVDGYPYFFGNPPCGPGAIGRTTGWQGAAAYAFLPPPFTCCQLIAEFRVSDLGGAQGAVGFVQGFRLWDNPLS